MNFFEHLRPGNLPQSVISKGPLASEREIILQWMYNILIGIVGVALPLILIFLPDVLSFQMKIFTVLAFAILFVLAYRRQTNYNMRTSILILFLMIIGMFAVYSNSLLNFGWMFLFASVILSNLLLGHKFGITFFFLAIVGFVIIGFLTVNGQLHAAPTVHSPANPSSWILSGVVFLFTVLLSMTSVINLIRNMDLSIKAGEKLTQALEEEQNLLEQRVEERSAALNKRVDQFEVASQIARQISGEMNLDSLLNTATNLIRDRFAFYHVGVFLNDEKNEFAVLRAATGEAGRQMLERNHRLKIGEIGLVGYTTSHGEAKIALNVASDTQHFKNPLLPETRSEMALPLRIGDETIGALDVQSVVENAFSQDDIRILQTIADQLAIAVQKARLVEQLQRTVDELESSYQVTTQKAWRAHLRSSRQKLAYRYSGNRLENQAEETEHANQALTQGKAILTTTTISDHERPVAVLAVPIKLRNQVLGVVDIHFDSANVSPDLISLIEGTVNRLAISLENARLMEEIQFRAERERMVSEISSKVRTASDVDTVLRVAVQELGKSLGVSEVMIQLRKDS